MALRDQWWQWQTLRRSPWNPLEATRRGHAPPTATQPFRLLSGQMLHVSHVQGDLARAAVQAAAKSAADLAMHTGNCVDEANLADQELEVIVEDLLSREAAATHIPHVVTDNQWRHRLRCHVSLMSSSSGAAASARRPLPPWQSSDASAGKLRGRERAAHSSQCRSGGRPARALCYAA